MPAAYESMRDKFRADGMGAAAAKGKAARIYNAKHPGSPVTGGHEKVGVRTTKPPRPGVRKTA
jgi:hypothetical protein